MLDNQLTDNIRTHSCSCARQEVIQKSRGIVQFILTLVTGWCQQSTLRQGLFTPAEMGAGYIPLYRSPHCNERKDLSLSGIETSLGHPVRSLATIYNKQLKFKPEHVFLQK